MESNVRPVSSDGQTQPEWIEPAVVADQAGIRSLALEHRPLHRVSDAAVVGEVGEHPVRLAEEDRLDDEREEERSRDHPEPEQLAADGRDLPGRRILGA